MEVEEEDTSKHLQESTTTTVSNESLLENNSRNDIELGIEVPESNTQEEQGEKSPVVSPQFDDPNHFVAVAVGETTEENQALAECSNSEPGGAANDGISTSDAAATEPGGSELPNSTKLNGGESEAAVILRDSSLDVVEKDINNSEGDTNTNDSLATENDKDGGEGKMETVKVDEAGEALEEGGGVDVPLLPITEIGEREEVMEDVGSDGIGIVLGDDAEVVADEEEGPGKTAGEDKATGGTENDEEEPTMADEEKSLDTELDSDEEKVPPEEMETELAESGVKSGRRKRKRGKNAKATPKSTTASKQTIEEDVCFVCFDGGDLVLCDVRTCPKAYHPSCVNRDAAFFQTKGRWNCVGLYQ